VIVIRFLKDATTVLDDPMDLNLPGHDMLSLIEKEPEVQAKKLMSAPITSVEKKI